MINKLHKLIINLKNFMYYNLLSKIKFLGGAVATIVQHLRSR